jgi:hypothetical protein
MRNLDVYSTQSFHISKIGEMFKGKEALTQRNLAAELHKISGITEVQLQNGSNANKKSYGVFFSTEQLKNKKKFLSGNFWRFKTKSGKVGYELITSVTKVSIKKGARVLDGAISSVKKLMRLL